MDNDLEDDIEHGAWAAVIAFGYVLLILVVAMVCSGPQR